LRIASLVRQKTGRMRAQAFLALLVALGILSFGRLSEASTGRATATVPLILVKYNAYRGITCPRVAVKLSINGTGSGAFAIDTGSDFSMISDSTAAKLGLKPGPLFVHGEPLMKYGQVAQTVLVQELRLGDLQLGGMYFIVLSEKYIHALLGGSLDGLIGADKMSEFAWYFEFGKRRVTAWYPSDLSDSEVRGLGLAEPGIQLQLAADFNYVPAVAVQFDNSQAAITESMIVDTGSQLTILPQSDADKLGLAPSGTTYREFGYYGEYTVDCARVGSVSAAGATSQGTVIGYFSTPTEHPPVLGMDFLSTRDVLIDFGAKMLYFKAPGR